MRPLIFSNMSTILIKTNFFINYSDFVILVNSTFNDNFSIRELDYSIRANILVWREVPNLQYVAPLNKMLYCFI